MKKNNLLLLASTFMFACCGTIAYAGEQNAPSEPEKTAKIEVLGASSRLIGANALSNNVTKGLTAPKGVRDTIVMKVKDKNCVCVTGINNKVYLVMVSEDKMVTIDARQDKVVLSGENEKINTFLAELSHDIFYSFDNAWLGRYISLAYIQQNNKTDYTALTADTYLGKIKKLEKDCYAKLKKARIKDSEVNKMLKSELEGIFEYAIFDTYRCLTYNKLKVPENLLAEILNYDFDAEKMAENPRADLILYTYVKAKEDIGEVKYGLHDYVASKANVIPDQTVKENYILKELENLVNRKSFIFVKELFASCEPLLKSKESIAKFQALKTKLDSELAKNKFDGVPAMDFTYENQNGEMVSLSDFKGKYVYIDIWATWCGPCKQEIPHLKRLEKELEGENIVFVSISTDRQSSKETWKKFIKDNDIHCTTLITPNGPSAPFNKHYRISGIPRFMLVSPDGTMISNNCWRPSDPRLKEYLLLLLNNK